MKADQIIEVGAQGTSITDKQPDQQTKIRQAEIEKLYRPHAVDLTPFLFSVATVAVVYLGWQADLENYITPESGLGYALGIIGGVMMSVMLLYSLRKRAKWMRGMGQVRYWFRAHMIFGIVGPVVILFHCNFQLGSQNSNIAFFSMLLVATSGVIGRYIYGRIHYGVYGSKMTLQQLLQDDYIARHELSQLFEINPELYEQIKKYDGILQTKKRGIIASFLRLWRLNIQTRHSYCLTRRLLIKSCRQKAVEEVWKQQKIKDTIEKGTVYLKAHFMTVRKLAGLTFFESLFSLWHILHLPLFFMLVVTVIIHIIAVHFF